MQIQRNMYLNQIIEAQNNGMVKIITGIRRCGKSYLLFNIFKEYVLYKGVPTDHIMENSIS